MSKRHTRRDHKTTEDQARITAIKEIGCICCKLEGLDWVYCEWHHITISGFTQGHQKSIGLCLWHHKGICEEGLTSEQMRQKYGPSLAKGSKPFHANYGTNEFLLGYQDKLIKDKSHDESIYA